MQRTDIEDGEILKILEGNKEAAAQLEEARVWFKRSRLSIRELSQLIDVSPIELHNILEPKIPRPPRQYVPVKPRVKIGDQRRRGGYLQIYVGLDYSGAMKDGWMSEHRKIMQDALGRPLRPFEVVHHKNRNKEDNRVENLEVLSPEKHPVCMRCPFYLELQQLKSKN